LLERRGEDGETTEYLAEISSFIQRGSLTGAVLDARSDRWQAQNLLDYWANELYHARHDAPATTLVTFNPASAPVLDDNLCPYLGLKTFGPNKHPFFFGRNLLIDSMIEKLKYNRFLAIAGPSGSGKSSVALAGLIPQMQKGALHGSRSWRYYQAMVPGADPQANLARIIEPEKAADINWVKKTAEQSQQDPSFLAKMIDSAGEQPAVIVVDQFEEIFTFCYDNNKRRAFINTLLELIQNPNNRHTVIITMRTDLESNMVQWPSLLAFYEQSQVRMTAMKASELREAIEKPAELVGLKFEENLVDEMIREVLGKPEALPLLQFTLLKLWENRDHNRITTESYHRLGGGQQTLTNTADSIYEALSPEDKVSVRRIFLRIVRPSVELQITRDRVLRSMLYEIGLSQPWVDRIVDHLIDGGLLRLIDGTTPADDMVGLAHESLVRIWPRLTGWLEEERVAQRRRLRLTTTAEQWLSAGEDESALLRGLLLEEALRYEDLSDVEARFVETSVEAAHRAERDREAAQQRQLEQAQALAEEQRQRAEESARFVQRLSWLTAALAVVFVLAVVAALTAARNGGIAEANAEAAVKNQIEAEQLRVTAESSAVEAREAQNAALADANLRATAEAEARQQRDAAEQSLIEAVNARATAVASAAEAATAQAVAETNAQEAEAQNRLATSRELAAAAVDQLNSEPQLGLLLALEAVNKTYSVNQTASAEAEDALYRALQASQLQLTLSGHTDWVTDVAFSPDGTKLATTSLDNTVRVWDSQSGQVLLTLEDHSRGVNTVAFSPDSARLATAGDDGFIIVWNAETGVRLGVFKDENGTIRGLEFSPDNVHLAAAYEDFTVRIWNTTTRRSLYRLFGHENGVTDVAFSPDGGYFASSAEDGRVIVWDMETGAPVYPINPDDGDPVIINGLAFSPDGTRIVTANNDGTAKVWDYLSGELLLTLFGHTSRVIDAVYSPDGALLATASSDGTVKVWQADSGQGIYSLSGHSGGVNGIAFSPDSQRIATASQDGTAKVWLTEPGLDVLILSGHSAPLHSIVFNDTGELVGTTSEDTTAKVWNSATGELVMTFTDQNATVTDVVFSPNGRFAVTTSDDFNARIWDMATGDLRLPLMSHRGPVNRAVFNSDGQMLATASDDGTAVIWNTTTNRRLSIFELDAPVIGVAFSPDNAFLATAVDDGRVVIWEISSGTAVLTLTGHEGPVNDVVYSGDGQHLVTASSDGTAKLWDTNGELLRTFAGHNGPVLNIALSPDGSRLATASVDKTAKLWNTETGQALRTLTGHTSTVYGVAFSPDGLRLATASVDRTAQIIELTAIGELFERGLTRTARPLTAEECTQYLRGTACLTTASSE
jgi:WD40 repeat protein/energy-coupling factor transporter ATP-binding protein EcfA2